MAVASTMSRSFRELRRGATELRPRPPFRRLVTGYLHPAYAASLSEFGIPRRLGRSGGWILVRNVPGYLDCRDGIGCYPFLVCSDWSGLCADVEELGREIVSLAVVTDPFAPYEPKRLLDCFDTVRKFKEHHVVDLQTPRSDTPSRHHRQEVRRALKRVRVEEAAQPARHTDEWLELYGSLVERRRLSGLRGFSRTAVQRQLEVPGAVLFRAVREGVGVAAHLWYLQGNVGYSHLQASSPEGYRVSASYALYWTALESLAGRVEWLALGAAPGTEDTEAHGLSFFKRGWATGTRDVHFCTRVFDRARYASLSNREGAGDSSYFPAYRHGEVA